MDVAWVINLRELRHSAGRRQITKITWPEPPDGTEPGAACRVPAWSRPFPHLRADDGRRDGQAWRRDARGGCAGPPARSRRRRLTSAATGAMACLVVSALLVVTLMVVGHALFLGPRSENASERRS